MSEKTKQSFLNFTVNFWSRDWEGRRPWMKSFRKVEGDGRVVRRQTWETTQLGKEGSVSITCEKHSDSAHCSTALQ